MESREAARAFADLFHRVYLAYYERHAPTEYQPSREAMAVLQHLAGTGPLTVSEAARHFSRSQAATSELVDRLERRGLVERAPDERDRRRHLIWLTPRGLEVWERSSHVLSVARLATAFEALPAARRQEVLSAMESLLEPRDRSAT